MPNEPHIVKIRRVAGSIVVSIPRSVLEASGLVEGERVFLRSTGRGTIVLSKLPDEEPIS